MPELDSAWVASEAAAAAERLERDIEALVAVSSPSGDVAGAEEAIAIASALLPAEARTERLPCSSPDHADDLCARLEGTGTGRVLLLGHLDTVHSHADHKPLTRAADRLVGSGSIDMKGGDALAIAAMRSLAGAPAAYAEAALLLVVDEEWRTGGFAHGPGFEGWDACLCFEAGEEGPDGEPAVVLRRKAAGTLRVRAHGRAAHSGSAPDRGRSALLPLAATAERIAALHAPDGPDRLSAVPTVFHSGDAFNVVPAEGELICDLRADSLGAFEPVLAAVPPVRTGSRSRPRSSADGPAWTRATSPHRSLSAPGPSRAGPCSALSAAAPATRATWPSTCRSPSTASARSAATPTRPTSTCSPSRSGRAPRSRWRWWRRCSPALRRAGG